jgi:hypothetical protein
MIEVSPLSVCQAISLPPGVFKLLGKAPGVVVEVFFIIMLPD